MKQIINWKTKEIIVEYEGGLKEFLENNLHINFNYAELNNAKLNDAELNGAKLNYAKLNYAELNDADLSNSIGLLNPIEWLEQNLEEIKDGFIVYKTLDEHHKKNDKWDMSPGSVITEECNFNRTNTCVCGINCGTKEYVLNNTKGDVIYMLLIRFKWLAGVCVPYNTDGKFRVAKAENIKAITREELRAMVREL